MKTKTSNFTWFTLKAFFISTMIIFAFANFTICDAQAIVGKWNEVSNKQFYTPEGVKQIGKSVIEGTTSTPKFQFEFKADHTYTEFSLHKKWETVTGTWSVSGNQLTMVAAAQKRAGKGSRIYTFSITGNTMTRTMIVQPPYNEKATKKP